MSSKNKVDEIEKDLKEIKRIAEESTGIRDIPLEGAIILLIGFVVVVKMLLGAI